MPGHPRGSLAHRGTGPPTYRDQSRGAATPTPDPGPGSIILPAGGTPRGPSGSTWDRNAPGPVPRPPAHPARPDSRDWASRPRPTAIDPIDPAPRGSATPVPLGQTLTVGTQHQRHVARTRGSREPQESLQQDLAGRGRQEVVPPHHLVDTLIRVVDDHGQVVGRHAVAPTQHEVVDHRIRTAAALGRRVPRRPRRHGGGPRRVRPCIRRVGLLLPAPSAAQVPGRRPRATGSVGCGGRFADLTAGTEARVGEAGAASRAMAGGTARPVRTGADTAPS